MEKGRHEKKKKKKKKIHKAGNTTRGRSP